MKTPCLVLAVITLLLTHTAYALHTDFYSEQAYLGRENIVANNLRVRTIEDQSELVIQPYLQVGSELQTGGPGTMILDPGASFVYLAPGARIVLTEKLSLLGELRVRNFYQPGMTNPQLAQRTLDARAVLVYGDFYLRRLAPHSPIALFAELYGEGVFTSGDFSNFICDGFARGGLRFLTSQTTSVDLYLEPFMTIDSVRHFYNNRADLKPSVRVSLAYGGLSIGVMASYLFNTYFSRGDFDYNPYAGKASGVRMLAVLGGAL